MPAYAYRLDLTMIVVRYHQDDRSALRGEGMLCKTAAAMIFTVVALGSQSVTAIAGEWRFGMSNDGPLAELHLPDSSISVICTVDIGLLFAMNFPSEYFPDAKELEGEVRNEIFLVYAKDAPQGVNFDVNVISNVPVAFFEGRALVVVPASVAPGIVTDLATARTNTYIGVTRRNPDETIFGQYYPVKGSTAAIDQLTSVC